MASVRRLDSGKWRAEIARLGIRKSKVFPTKSAAKDWASRQEYLILNADETASQETFGTVMIRYSRERSPEKRGARWEILRLEKIAKDKIGDIRMSDLRASDLANSMLHC